MIFDVKIIGATVLLNETQEICGQKLVQRPDLSTGIIGVMCLT